VVARRLDWDSQFFGMEVFGVTLTAGNEEIDMQQLAGTLRGEGAGLAYFFLQQQTPDRQQQLAEIGAILYDEKVTYSKQLRSPTGTPPMSGTPPDKIERYMGEATDELLELAFLAGHDSRFKKDPRLSPFFERLYTMWVINSLNGSMADRVFVYRTENRIAGLVSCKIGNDKTGNIGLIATRAAYQGKGVGTALLRATEAYYSGNNVVTSTVVTQKSNSQACLFYEKVGFAEYKTEYVYHLWFN
jgi:dTDP-4-amino-4,6-dideoxy-D-galactose acyltransferase